MNKINMLSAKNVKIHGMHSRRWTTKDKITQYKGLINLYKRDQKIAEFDRNVENRKQYRILKELKSNIEADRSELDNAIRGDRQKLRNTLADYKDMQLAYKNSLPKVVIENIHQINFGKRKELDRLTYKMKTISKQLVDSKLEYAVLEDQIKYASLSVKTQLIKKSEMITGKVQDAILRREAALAINQIYQQMINVMKKVFERQTSPARTGSVVDVDMTSSRDALYFDTLLITINNDGINQNKCMVNATKLGQMATEYLDDRKSEYKHLEFIVKQDMKSRKEDLERIQADVNNAGNNLRKLLRRDSDVNIGRLELPYTESMNELQSEMNKLENALITLKKSTMVVSFELIQPCLENQMVQKERLMNMVKQSECDKEILVNKSNHADLMNDQLRNTMNETTFEYKEGKSQLTEAIDEKMNRKNEINKLIMARYELTAKMRISFKQLQEICKMIGPEMVKGKPKIIEEDLTLKPEIEENDIKKIIANITTKLQLLTKNAPKTFDTSLTDQAFKYYEMMMKERSITISTEQVIGDESLLEGLELEVSHVLTREDIKNQSEQIVIAATKDDEFAPVVSTKKKKKK